MTPYKEKLRRRGQCDETPARPVVVWLSVRHPILPEQRASLLARGYEVLEAEWADNFVSAAEAYEVARQTAGRTPDAIAAVLPEAMHAALLKHVRRHGVILLRAAMTFDTTDETPAWLGYWLVADDLVQRANWRPWEG